MKKLYLILLGSVFLLTCCTAWAEDQNTKAPAPVKKQIATVVEKFPNYVYHLMALAEVGFTSDYIKNYSNSAYAEDIDYLKQHKNLLQWMTGNISDLTIAFFFLPCYINLDSQDNLKEYFTVLDESLKTHNFQKFITRYNSYFQRWNNDWMPVNPENLLKKMVPYQEIVHQLGQIYIRNYPLYENQVWPKEQPKLGETSASINKVLREKDFIAAWEHLTGQKFRTATYDFVLCSALKDGPNFSSLGYDRNTCYPGNDVQTTIQMISHETGTHLLFDTFKDVMSLNRFDYGTLYKAYECMAEFYNSKIISGKLAYSMKNFEDGRFVPIYETIYRDNPSITPKDLLIQGLEVYSRR